jgi:hypothetical protein
MNNFWILSDSSDDDLDLMSRMLFQSQAIATETGETVRTRERRAGRRPNIDRLAQEGAERLVADYFSDIPTYSDEQFRRRFRMNRDLFVRIARDVEAANIYFVQRPDATGKLGLTA